MYPRELGGLWVYVIHQLQYHWCINTILTSGTIPIKQNKTVRGKISGLEGDKPHRAKGRRQPGSKPTYFFGFSNKPRHLLNCILVIRHLFKDEICNISTECICVSYFKANVLRMTVKNVKSASSMFGKKEEVIPLEFNWQHLPLQGEYITGTPPHNYNKAVNQKCLRLTFSSATTSAILGSSAGARFLISSNTSAREGHCHRLESLWEQLLWDIPQIQLFLEMNSVLVPLWHLFSFLCQSRE